MYKRATGDDPFLELNHRKQTFRVKMYFENKMQKCTNANSSQQFFFLWAFRERMVQLDIALPHTTTYF